MWFDVSFGSDKAGLSTVGYRQYNSSGGDAVARTTTGVVEIGNGAYGVEVTPNVATKGIEWDTGEATSLYAHEDIQDVQEFPRGVAVLNFPVIMLSNVDHITPTPSLTVSGLVQIDGGSFVALTNAVSEVGLGLYKVNITAAEMNGDKITLRFTATGADPRTLTIFTNRG